MWAGSHCGVAVDVEQVVLVRYGCAVGTIPAAVQDDFFLACHRLEGKAV